MTTEAIRRLLAEREAAATPDRDGESSAGDFQSQGLKTLLRCNLFKCKILSENKIASIARRRAPDLRGNRSSKPTLMRPWWLRVETSGAPQRLSFD